MFVLQVKTAETRSVRHFHFTAWPDHGVPQTTELLISFRHLVREHMDQYSRHSPTVVHCRSDRTHTHTQTRTLLPSIVYNCLRNYPKIHQVFCLSLPCLCVYVVCTQCRCWTHRYLHCHWPFDLPDWKGKYCGRVWHRPWSAHAPAPHGADRGRTRSHALLLTVHVVWNDEYSAAQWTFVFDVLAGPVCVLKPVCLGHHQIKNWNQRGSNLPKRSCAVYLRERRTKKGFPQKRVPQCIGLLLLSLLLARKLSRHFVLYLSRFC